MGRYARMYAAFNVFYLLTVFSIWRFLVERTSPWGTVVCIVLAVLTISLHRLGYTLVLFFFASTSAEGSRPAPLGVARVVGARDCRSEQRGVFSSIGSRSSMRTMRHLRYPCCLRMAGRRPSARSRKSRKLVLNEINPPTIDLFLSLWQKAPAVLLLFAVSLIGSIAVILRRWRPRSFRSCLAAVDGWGLRFSCV